MKLIDRSFKVLELLSKYPKGISISEISTTLDLPLSTTHRLLKAIIKNGYASQDLETNKYKMSLKLVSLARGYLGANQLINMSKPHLKELFDKYREVVFLSSLEGEKIICIDSVNIEEGVNFYVRVGSEMPINSSSAAQAIVAFLEPGQIDSFIENGKHYKYTRESLINPINIKEKLNKIKKDEYAVCDEEFEEGVIGISAPIRDKNCEVIASLSMIWIKDKNNNISEKVSDLKITARSISFKLGCMNL